MKKQLLLRRETIRTLQGRNLMVTPEMGRVQGGTSWPCAVSAAVSVEVVNETLSDPISHVGKKIKKAASAFWNNPLKYLNWTFTC